MIINVPLNVIAPFLVARTLLYFAFSFRDALKKDIGLWCPFVWTHRSWESGLSRELSSYRHCRHLPTGGIFRNPLSIIMENCIWCELQCACLFLLLQIDDNTYSNVLRYHFNQLVRNRMIMRWKSPLHSHICQCFAWHIWHKWIPLCFKKPLMGIRVAVVWHPD